MSGNVVGNMSGNVVGNVVRNVDENMDGKMCHIKEQGTCNKTKISDDSRRGAKSRTKFEIKAIQTMPHRSKMSDRGEANYEDIVGSKNEQNEYYLPAFIVHRVEPNDTLQKIMDLFVALWMNRSLKNGRENIVEHFWKHKNRNKQDESRNDVHNFAE